MENYCERFLEMFDEEEMGTFSGCRTADTIEAARDKVVRLLEESKSLFRNPKYTYRKAGKVIRPVPCFGPQGPGKFSVRVMFSRITLEMPNGKNAIICPEEKVIEVHEKLQKLVREGVFDQQIQKARDRYRQSQACTVEEDI